MTRLTPTFAELHNAAVTNGQAGPIHVTPAHEPTREGDKPVNPAAPSPLTQPAQGSPAPVLQPAPLKVALIGTAPSSRMLAPFGDPSWKIWACSPGNMNQLPRVDVWFELHSNLLWPEHESYGRPYIEWLKTVPFPVFMQDNTLVPNATPFPMLDMVQEFGRSFFTSSFAWMMALAIRHGASEIALYGIDMASRDEYIQQRPGFYYFKDQAERRGIKISAPHESDIMQPPPLYAYVDSTPIGRKFAARRTEVQGRVGGMTQQRDQLNNNINYLQGALEDIDYMQSIWSGAMDEITLLRAENAMLKTAFQTERDARLLASLPVFTAPQPPSEPKPRRRRKKTPEETAPEASTSTIETALTS